MSNTIREPPGWNPPPWVAVRPTAAYFKAAGMPPEACKAWVLDTMRGCMTGEREEGSDADRLLRDAAERMAKRSNAGKAGAAGRWGASRDASAMRTECERNAEVCHDRRGQDGTDRRGHTHRTGHTGHTEMTDRQTRPRGNRSGIEGEDSPAPTRPPTTDPIPPPTASPGRRHALDKFAADPYGYRNCIPADLLPNCAVLFCEEADPERALTTFQRQMKRIGVGRFREIFNGFMDDCSHSDPANRGAALVARLQTLGDIADHPSPSAHPQNELPADMPQEPF